MEKIKRHINKKLLSMAMIMFIGFTFFNSVKAYASVANYTTIVSGLNFPTGIAIDSSGNLLVISNNDGGSIRKYTVDGTYLGTVASGIGRPYGITIDKSSGDILVTNCMEGTIKRYTADGTYICTFASSLGFTDCMAIDGDHNILVTHEGEGAITKYAFDGTSLGTIVSGLNIPTGIAVDSNGNILVAEFFGSDIKEYTSDGTFIRTLISGVNTPFGLAIDSDGNIIVTELFNGNIKEYTADGTFTKTLVSGLLQPQGLAIGSSDEVYFTDRFSGIVGIVKTTIVKNIDSIADIAVPNGTDKNHIGLPTSVDVTLSDSTTTSAAVTWDNGIPGYDGNTEGQYTFTGVISLPVGITNPSKLKAHVNVIVGAPASKVVASVSSINDISVENGTNLNDLRLPTSVGVTLNDSTTTSAAVTWDNGNPEYDGDREGTYRFTGALTLQNGILNTNSLKASVNVIVGPSDNPPLNGDVTTPASVIIKGTERVGKTLEAELLTESKAKFTTSAGVTYEWYRLSDKDSCSGTLVEDEETYKLVGSDKGNYIKVIVDYNGQTFEDITGRIARRSSSGSSSSSSDDSADSNEDNNASKKSSELSNGWENRDGNTRRYIENGKPVTDWKFINGAWYLFDSAGIMQTGWRQSGNDWYYLNSNGVMETGWELVNDKWYLLKENGAMSIGWVNVGGKWYYLDPDGAMETGWIKLDGKWYYLYGDGSLAINTTINGCYVDENGVWV